MTSVTPDIVFRVVNTVALVAWLTLIILPGRRWVTTTVTGSLVPMLFATLYIAIVVTTFGGAEGSFATLSGVAELFTNRWLLLAGWVHYLAFDLLIGTWEAGDAEDRGVPHALLVPCLLLTFIFGPAGWLLYRMVRVRYNAPRTGSRPDPNGPGPDLTPMDRVQT